jgi:hypothetical protein
MILSLLLGAACVTTAEIDPPMSWDSALPLQASVCDVAGIGRVLTQNGTNANVQIDLLWYGSVTNNLLCLDTSGDTSLPTNSAPFVLFASQYGTFLNLEPMECRFSYIFDMDYHRTRYEPDGMYLLNGDRSWFPVTPENAQMVNWCSNLVYVAQVTTNRQAFYELIREGYRLHPETSRIHRDSEYAFQYFHYYMTTNFMQQVWSDTNLVGWARSWVNMSYQQETKTWLP